MVQANAGNDVTYDSPPGSLQLDGTASSSPGRQIVSYKWYIVDQPEGANAAFDDDTSSKPTLSGIDRPGTYRVFLVVTDDLGDKSEENPYEAPEAAFANIMVKTAYKGLVMPAAGQRNWDSYVNQAINQLDETANYAETHKIEDHPNCQATTTELNELTGHAGAFNADAMHRHTHRWVMGARGHKADTGALEGGLASGVYAAARVAGTLTIKRVGYTMLDGGKPDDDNTAQWQFGLYKIGTTEFESAAWAQANVIATFTPQPPSTPHSPLQGTTDALDVSVGPDEILILKIDQVPTGTNAETGDGLDITIEAEATG